jgi:hypothetical protein
MIPRCFTAVIAYSEHVGKYRHVGLRFSGDSAARYTCTGRSRRCSSEP